MLSSKYTFSKEERVKSKKEMSRIFKDGTFLYSEHITMGFVKSIDIKQKQHKLAISVPKKVFKLAVHRNKVKRLIREAYRLNKFILYNNIKGFKVFYNIVFIYRNKDISKFETIQKDIIKLLESLNNREASKILGQ